MLPSARIGLTLALNCRARKYPEPVVIRANRCVDAKLRFGQADSFLRRRQAHAFECHTQADLVVDPAWISDLQAPCPIFD